MDNNLILGIIIFGSASSVTERVGWQHRLEMWLMPAMKRGIPTLGICYGHQMIAHMFGAKIEYRYPDQFKMTGFREVPFQNSRLWTQDMGELVISHNEVVASCPAEMKVIASTETVAIEALEHISLPIWTLQAHPEATRNFLVNEQIQSQISEKRLKFGHSLVKKFIELTGK